MGRTIANATVFFLIILAVLAVPALALGYISLSSLSTAPSIIVIFLAGFLVGVGKHRYLEDNITTIVLSLGILGFLQLFLSLSFLYSAVIYLVGYVVGRKILHEELEHSWL